MPGVPTSRRCDSCRHRKKKCDLRQPSCSRCIRLGVTCVGSGQQRYKFVNDQANVSERSTPSTASPTTAGIILESPCNDLTMVRGSLCSILQVSDTRYDLSMYGVFLEEIPKRLGSNLALDASAKALVHCFTSFRSKQSSFSMVESYVQALSTLRTCLDDPKGAASMDTLCAIYLMIICQTLMGDGLLRTHGEGLSHMLKLVSSTTIDQNDMFAHQLLLTLCVPVIIESLVNPNIQLYPWLELLVEERDKSMPFQSLRLMQLAKLRDYMADPIKHELEIRQSYQRTGLEVLQMQQTLRGPMAQLAPAFRARFHVAYSVALSYAIIMNTIMIRSFEPFSPGLARESSALLDEIIALTENSFQFRPIGASAIPTMLLSAWPNDPFRRPRIEELFDECQADFHMNQWKECAIWLDLMLGGSVLGEPSSNQLPPTPTKACNVM